MTDQNLRGISRRSITKGVAWAAPVVAVAAAAPFAAASYDTPEIDFDAKSACKFPGKSTDCVMAYRFVLSVTNPVNFDVTLNITSLSEDGEFTNNFTVMPDYSTLESGSLIPKKSTLDYTLVVGPSGNSSDQSARICLYYTYSYVNNAGQTIVASVDGAGNSFEACFDYNGSNPCAKDLCVTA